MIMGNFSKTYLPPEDWDATPLCSNNAQQEVTRTFKNLVGGSIMNKLCLYKSNNESFNEVKNLCTVLPRQEGAHEMVIATPIVSTNECMFTTTVPQTTWLFFNQGKVIAITMISSVPGIEQEKLGIFLIALGSLQKSRLEEAGY